jgi:hypothetical protein
MGAIVVGVVWRLCISIAIIIMVYVLLGYLDQRATRRRQADIRAAFSQGRPARQ